MNYRTNKCNHGQKGRCINCLTQQLKVQKKNTEQNGILQQKKKCIHPPNMKCLKCMNIQSKIISKIHNNGCNHQNYEICDKCKKKQQYQTFQYYIQKLIRDCKHKKPCKKCVPIQAKKTFGIDRECRNHLPFPQAQCDACMAPTISIQKQTYSHVHKVIIQTTSIYKIIQANLFGILLGKEKDGIVYVQDMFFPQEQVPNSLYIQPDILNRYKQMFQQIGYSIVGLIYSSSEITAMSLMLSSIFQDYFLTVNQNGYQISKFITMRLHWNEQDPYFECFMVSDQFQKLHINNMIFEKNTNKDYFDLITAIGNKNDKTKSMPTFLRSGIEIQQIYFKQIIVWIQTESKQKFQQNNINLQYPFFKLEQQKIRDMQNYLCIHYQDPIEKYRNVQFLLHMLKLFGKQNIILFVKDFIYDGDQLFLTEKIKQAKRRQAFDKSMEQSSLTTNY